MSEVTQMDTTCCAHQHTLFQGETSHFMPEALNHSCYQQTSLSHTGTLLSCEELTADQTSSIQPAVASCNTDAQVKLSLLLV